MLTGAAEQLIGMVIGPPGSGKTTLLGRVAAQARGPVAWYRLSSDDASEVAFVAHLGVALFRALNLPARPVAEISDLLLALQGWRGSKAVIVFDDVHEIVGSAAERALERFVALRPRALQVLIGSRRQPDINIPRLRVSGQLHEISGDDLRFRSWEVEELFLGIFAEPLSPESAAALTRRTGGWAAGLQLFHLSTRGRSAGDRHRAVNELNGRSKLVRSYLARNVISDLPEDRRDFLLKTSTLGPLTSGLCDSLLGRTGSGRILDELEQQQLFTSSDEDGQTYHYHEVLRAHLEWALIEEFGVDEARRWYSRSADVLEKAGNHHAAIRAHAKAEDWGSVARLLQSHESTAVDSAAGINLVLPPSVVQYDPWLSLAEARRRLRHGAAAGAAAAFAQAENLLDEPSFRDSCRRERIIAAMWTAIDTRAEWADGSRPPSDHWSATVRRATRHASLPPEPAAGAAAEQRLGWGVAALVTGRISDARRILGEVADRAADPTHGLLAKLAVTVIDIVTVGLEDPVDRLESITIEAEFVGLPWVERLSRGVAECVLVSGGATWRVAAGRDIVEECERHGDPWGAAILRLAGALAQQLVGSSTETGDFTDAAARFRRLDAPVPALWAEALHAWAVGSERLMTDVRVAARSLQLPMVEVLVAAGPTLGSLGPAEVRPPLPSAVPQPRQAAAAPVVVIRCFGGFGLEIDGVSVDLGTLRPRARALLRMLALNAGRDVHQESLVEALWPGVELPVGIRRLQVAISSVRQLLERHGLAAAVWLPRHGNAYRLVPDTPDVVDVVGFEHHLRQAMSRAVAGDRAGAVRSRERALALYRGDLLPEDGPVEHVVGERERLRRAGADAAIALAGDLQALGEIDKAVAAVRTSLRLERFCDAAWELLVQLHEAAGDLSAAARTRREHAHTVHELESVDS